MPIALVACNSEVLKLLGGRASLRLGLELRVAGTGRQVLDLARQIRPQVVILDAEMPGLTGFEICRGLKADPDLARSRVMMIVSGILGKTELERLTTCGCDDVLVLPAIGEELWAHLADLLEVPRRRSRRLAVQLTARLQGGTEKVDGVVENLSLEGAKVKLTTPLGAVDRVNVRLTAVADGSATAVDARVVWRREDGCSVGLEFRDLTPQAADAVAALALFEVVAEDNVLRVYLEGEFTENTSFAPLLTRLTGRVDFDAGGVSYINSGGAHRWIVFLRELKRVEAYTFSRCSVAFTAQAALVPEVIGSGRIVSFMAPFCCSSCDREETRLLQVQALARETGGYSVPAFRCAHCGGALVFDEIPKSYLAFLPR